jgi:hypothetical protein
VAAEVEAVEAGAVEEVKVKVAIEVGANIEVKDTAVKLEEEKVTITLVIGYCY